ncbi:MAG: hypothetical protein ACXVBK_15255 [Flavisolibacter sp.]
MTDKKQKDGSAAETASKNDKKQRNEPVMEKVFTNRETSTLAFSLVVIMLGTLFVIVLFLIFPLYYQTNKDVLEYYKWTLSVLLGAFGAWIGAGAAYFFGRENLKESSASTERAMQIQQQSFRRPSGIERIKDMTLTAMNSNFIFNIENKKSDVITKLKDCEGFWFVPVVNKISGVLEDIIHAQVFWDSAFMTPDTKIEDIIKEMDNKGLKKLHGDSFYAKVSPEDKISDVYDLISKKGAEVAIVVDQKGKASHCLTKTELRTFLNVADGT